MITTKTLTLPDGTTLEMADGDARDRLGKIEYQPVTTDLAFSHKNLPEGEKTVVFDNDGVWGDKAYINHGIDLLPRGGFHRAFPYRGLTIVQKGDIFKLTGQITPSAGVYFTKDGSSNFYIELPEGLTGKTVTLLGFTNSLLEVPTVTVTWYDADKAQISRKAFYLAKSSTILKQSFEIPEGTVYYSVQIWIGTTTELNHETKLYLLMADEIEEVSLADTTSKKGVIDITFSTLPYKSSVQYEVPLNEYISKFAGGGTVTYLTPEDFGAVGDGAEDDGEAIALCLASAIQTKQTVLMAKKYYITSPIVLSGNGLDIIANDIVYDGTDTAIKISGQNNTLKIHSITSGGVGISYRADNNKIVRYNDVEINAINSTTHGIVFYNGLMGIFQNTIKFNHINAGGNDTYGICELNAEGGSWVTENNFYGGQISNCDWAVYGVAGGSRLINIQVEGDVKGGFYIIGYVNIINPRWAESNRDGEYPFLKFVGTEIKHIKIYNNVPLPICEIDLSESDENNSRGDAKPEGHFAELNFPIISRRFGVGVDVNTAALLATQALVWGKYLILKPHMAYRKEVTTATLDTRLIGQEATEEEIRALSPLPTKFVVNSTNTDIYLHESYCAFGFNEFEVEQANGFTCKVYDKLNNLIFDGTEQGDGIYKFNVYKDSTYCANNSSGLLRRDFLGHYWQVLKLGATVV